MKEGGVGGGNTRTGLNFEVERDLLTALAKAPGYTVKDSTILYVGVEVARSYRKHSFYKMLSLRGVDYRQHLSKKLLPDDALFVIVNNTLFIIEMKFQKATSIRRIRKSIFECNPLNALLKCYYDNSSFQLIY